MKIYISGKITGLTPEEYEHNFYLYERQIKAHGHEPINPLNILPFDENHKWTDYMRADIKALMECDAVFAMKNYRESIGARIEVGLARDLDIPVIERMGDLPLA